MPKLVVLARGKPREIEMGQELTIGRGYSNLLRLEGEEISRVHAIIYRRGEEFVLRDLDSKNGVYLNGSKVNHAHLGSGDRVQVGKYKMVFNPPAEFDFGLLSEGGSGGGIQTHKEAPLEPPHDDSEFSSSRRFKVAVASPASAGTLAQVAADCSREDVTIITRHELERRMSEASGRMAEIAADYQDLFLSSLLRADRKPTGFSAAVLDALVEAVSADRGVVILRDKDSGSLTPGAIIADEPDVAVNRIVLKAGFAEEKSILCPRTDEAGLFRENNTVRRDRIASLISVPIGKDSVKGIIYVDKVGEAEPFTSAHLIAVGRVARLLELHFMDKERDQPAEDIVS